MKKKQIKLKKALKYGKSKAGSKANSKNENLPSYIVGIDEVGRGPLAGPVTVGAFAIRFDKSVAQTYRNFHKEILKFCGKKYPIGIDSKKMTEMMREFWHDEITTNMIAGFAVVVSHASANDIDKKGIAVCIRTLIDLNLKKLSKKVKTPVESMQVFSDGGLKTSLPLQSQKTIIKGDEKELVISLASVFAKVTRDRHMKKLSKNSKYFAYGFDVHKGYGTAKHRTMIAEIGLSDEHRRSFCKSLRSLKK